MNSSVEHYIRVHGFRNFSQWFNEPDHIHSFIAKRKIRADKLTLYALSLVGLSLLETFEDRDLWRKEKSVVVELTGTPVKILSHIVNAVQNGALIKIEKKLAGEKKSEIKRQRLYLDHLGLWAISSMRVIEVAKLDSSKPFSAMNKIRSSIRTLEKHTQKRVKKTRLPKNISLRKNPTLAYMIRSTKNGKALAALRDGMPIDDVIKKFAFSSGQISAFIMTARRFSLIPKKTLSSHEISAQKEKLIDDINNAANFAKKKALFALKRITRSRIISFSGQKNGPLILLSQVLRKARINDHSVRTKYPSIIALLEKNNVAVGSDFSHCEAAKGSGDKRYNYISTQNAKRAVRILEKNKKNILK